MTTHAITDATDEYIGMVRHVRNKGWRAIDDRGLEVLDVDGLAWWRERSDAVDALIDSYPARSAPEYPVTIHPAKAG